MSLQVSMAKLLLAVKSRDIVKFQSEWDTLSNLNYYKPDMKKGLLEIVDHAINTLFADDSDEVEKQKWLDFYSSITAIMGHKDVDYKVGKLKVTWRIVAGDPTELVKGLLDDLEVVANSFGEPTVTDFRNFKLQYLTRVCDFEGVQAVLDAMA